MSELKQTPLCDSHKALGAKMVPFAGWLMPVSFSGIQLEHFAVRKACGIFDASHMGLVRISGVGALAFVQKISVNDASKLALWQSQYSAMCYPNGTVVDDIYVSRTGDSEYHIAINAGCKEKDVEWMNSHADSSTQIELLATGILAVQGPTAVDVITKQFGAELAKLPKNGAAFVTYQGKKMLATRTGYTGEDGFEVFPPNELLVDLLQTLLTVGTPFGLIPCGLGCRDTLRLESGFSLYGHELNDQINLVEAGLSWIVGWDKPSFLGREALLKIKVEGPKRKLVGLVAIDKALPRDGMTVLASGIEVGKVTSGGISPMLNQGVALAYVDVAHAKIGTTLSVQIRDQVKSFQVSARRFVGGK